MAPFRFVTTTIAKRQRTESPLVKGGEDSQTQMPGVTRQPKRLTGACIGERWETMVEAVLCRSSILKGSNIGDHQ